LQSNLKSSKGITVFIPNNYSPVLVQNNETQLADHMENPSALIYGEQLTDKSENGKSTANLIDNSVLNELQTTKNIENSESLKKAANLDLTELIRLII
ncbi:7577_t:CDS:2, partial [Racocetra persica]